MNNGTTGVVSVAVPATAQSGDWVVVEIFSFETDPSTCMAFSNRDAYHLWPVGVYVP